MLPGKVKTMRKKSEVRRQAIIDVAAEIFNEIGFDRTSMAEISSRLGGSKATLYSYFSSKEEIFLEVMRRQAKVQFESRFALLMQDVALTAEQTRATLRLFANQYLNLVLAPEIIVVRRLMIYHAEQSSLGCMYYDNGPKRGNQIIADFMARAMAAGVLRQADPALVAIQFRALIEVEWGEPRLLGAMPPVAPEQVAQGVERALDTFYRIYGT